LLLREEVERLEVEAAAEAVLDPRLAGGPALDQRLRTDPQRGDGADAGDDDATAHEAFATTRSITSPTVLTSLTSSPLSSTPYSSSTICASSTRSSESTSRSSSEASRLSWSRSVPSSTRPSKIVFSTFSGLTCVGILFVLLVLLLSLQALSPPSTVSVVPVTYEASSEARKRMQAATSSGLPIRRAGIAFAMSPSSTSSVKAVSISPGATALTVTPRRAASAATVLVKPITPAFEAE